MNSNDCNKNKMVSWWERSANSADVLLFLIVVAAMLMLALMILFIPLSSHAGGCLSMDVPPQVVLGNHDGDTFNVFGFLPGGVVKIRVQGVNTPELSKKKGEPDEPGAREAKEFTRQWLAKGPFRLNTCGKPTLDRIVATVERDGRTLAQDLIDAKLAK